MCNNTFFILKKANRIATVTLNHPPANVLSSAVLQELSSIIESLANDSNVKVIILNGKGKFFAAGADIREFTYGRNDQELLMLTRKGQQLFDRIEQLHKPIIAVLHGACLGGGLELAMACHIRLVSVNAKLGLPELQLGIIPGFAGTQRLPRYVGVAKAAELMLTSETISGEQAVQLGLANHAYPEELLLEKAYELADKLVSKSAVSVKYVLELLKGNINHSDFQNGVLREAELFTQVFKNDDAKEGISAFIEKRKPQFKDK